MIILLKIMFSDSYVGKKYLLMTASMNFIFDYKFELIDKKKLIVIVYSRSLLTVLKLEFETHYRNYGIINMQKKLIRVK